MEILSHASAKKKAEGFQILHFYWSFSNDIMAVKGLTGCLQWRSAVPVCLSLMCFFLLLFSFFFLQAILNIYLWKFMFVVFCFVSYLGMNWFYIFDLRKMLTYETSFEACVCLWQSVLIGDPVWLNWIVKIQLASNTLIVTDFIIFRKLLWVTFFLSEPGSQGMLLVQSWLP